MVVKNLTLHFNQHFHKEMIQFCDDYKIQHTSRINSVMNEVRFDVKGELYAVEKLEKHLLRLNEGFGEYIQQINDYNPA
jgi:hypothetical protein